MVIMEGVAALQFDHKTNASSREANQNFAALYSKNGINVTECLTQFDLAGQNKLLTERSHKTLRSAWAFL